MTPYDEFYIECKTNDNQLLQQCGLNISLHKKKSMLTVKRTSIQPNRSLMNLPIVISKWKFVVFVGGF